MSEGKGEGRGLRGEGKEGRERRKGQGKRVYIHTCISQISSHAHMYFRTHIRYALLEVCIHVPFNYVLYTSIISNPQKL